MKMNTKQLQTLKTKNPPHYENSGVFSFFRFGGVRTWSKLLQLSTIQNNQTLKISLFLAYFS